MVKLPSLRQVEEARERVSGDVVETPLIPATINGRSLWLKCECLQDGGAFKLRGATNRLKMLDAAERKRGVVAFSSGNHARGVAIAARRLGIEAVIVMPSDAPEVKIDGTRSEGAAIRFYDRSSESREEIAAQLARESGATLVPSFDDPAIIAGQGTVGLEILDQLQRRGLDPPPMIVVPCGGGGLASGIALACPASAIVAIEPEGWDDMARSLEEGEIKSVPADAPPTLCDALQTPRVSPLTLAILAGRGAASASVNDAEVRAAMRIAHREYGLTVEPGGAAGLAACLAGKVDTPEGSAVVISGGNVDPALFARVTA